MIYFIQILIKFSVSLKQFFFIVLDIDECATNVDTCSLDGICENTLGSYICRCKVGFSGDGRTCTGVVYIFICLKCFQSLERADKTLNNQVSN